MTAPQPSSSLPLSHVRVAVGVGGGIAAYKACELVRELARAGAEVRVAMTPSAEQFVTALTFQALTNRPVLTNVFDPAQEASFGHIEFARWADLYILAPATADLLARVRAGMANDAVTTSLLAYTGPVLLAPAMNVAMFQNPHTQDNFRALVANPRYRTVGPDAGLLACGEVGSGRLAEVPEIVRAAAELVRSGPLSGRKVLITAGPTREFFDPVRFLSNPSTGKMGLALAHAARARGAEVTVVLGPVERAERQGLDVVDVVSAEEMASAVLERVSQADYFVATAAVSDYRPKVRHPHKVKKSATEPDGSESLELVRTPDILLEASRKVHAASKRPVLVGFAAETQDVMAYARRKLEQKDLDFIVANDVSEPGAGFGTDTNRVMLLSRSGDTRQFQGDKRDVARALWDALLSSSPPAAARS